ncbi:hypothetical protein ACFQH6_03585 [Halobacteriaceae archaeon GCM10025711]
MSGLDRWYIAPDDTLVTWAFLTLTVSERDGETRITAWELGFGNSVHLLETKSREATESGETAILADLLADLDEHRYDGVVLVTPTASEIPVLRRRLAESGVEDPSLRGLRHLSLDELLIDYFGSEGGTRALQSAIERQPESVGELTLEEMWQLVNGVGPLAPRRALEGTRL